ncbi:MAG: serine hydrolase, partial [Kamptonema sp. SIO1D9]|nr:serine hydrolase [Kamptonema sp. SIO1D9]
VNGQKRYAVVLVSNTGSDAKAWWYYTDLSFDEMMAKARDNNARLVDLETYVVGNKQLFSGVMIRNTGADRKAWWVYSNKSPAFISSKLQENNARLIDIEKRGNNTFTVIMERSEGQGWWWYYGKSAAQVNELWRQNGARIFDIEPYTVNGQKRFAVLMLSNITPSDIPITGSGDRQLQPILQALTDFMHHRCVGAAILGVSVKGQPVGVWGLGRMSGRASNSWDRACGDELGTPLASEVQPDTPMRIGSISKPVTFAMVRWALKKVAKEQANLDLTDEQIEGMKLFDPEHYPPQIPGTNQSYPVEIIPRDLYNLFSGKVKYPVSVKDSWQYGGDRDKERLCADLNSGFADPQWQNVTLGHFLSHRTGLQRSAPKYAEDIVDNLPIVRNLKTSADFQGQEQQLTDQFGSQAVNAAKTQLNLTANRDGYLIPAPTLAETMKVLAGRCLRYPLGENHYSNTSPAFPVIILEQLMASGHYAAEVGKPETHQESALQVFFQTELGVPTTGTKGIFKTQVVENIPGYPNPEPIKRHWNGQTYNWTAWDTKRLHCVWNNGTCNFDSWKNSNPGRLNWSLNLAQIPFSHTGLQANPGTGSLATDARTFLKFMAEYWVSGYGNNPRIGEERNDTWTRDTRHNGKYNGALAWAMQLGGNNNINVNLPPINNTGRITDDFANLNPVSISLPDGVDVFVAINQTRDRKCATDNRYDCDEAYDLLNNFVLYGVSQVNWSQVTPNLSLRQR